MKLATGAQMREMDRRAVEEFGIPSIVLMENAAIRVADEIARRYGSSAVCTVVCGPGNNGGDGIAIARHLAMRCGMDVQIFLCQEEGAKTTQGHDTNLEIARSAGLPVRGAGNAGFEARLGASDVIVDAMLGTGAKGNPRALMAKAIEVMNSLPPGIIVAVNVPSGVDADIGAVGSPCIKARLTVTLGLSKIGLHLSPGAEFAGELLVGDLCVPRQLTDDNAGIFAIRTDAADVASWLPARAEARDVNKSVYGAVALFAGSNGFAGAATLCCLGAAKSGAGLVTLGIPEGLLDVMMARLPDVVMARGFLDTGGRAFRAAAVAPALQFVAKMDAVGFGPGISHEDQEIRTFAREFIAQCPKPMVIDADAITILSLEADHGAGLVKGRKSATILTPHPGEMGRLLGRSTKDVQADRLGSVRRAADLFGCIVLLKGDRTLIAAPDGRLAINETSNSGMASGGMGDILTGISSTFLAQVKDPFHAAAAAAYVHGLAGDLAAAELGKAGLTATDLAGFVPAAIRSCLQEKR